MITFDEWLKENYPDKFKDWEFEQHCLSCEIDEYGEYMFNKPFEDI